MEKKMRNKMRNVRFFENLTLDQMYLRTGISQSKLSRIERGFFLPSQEEKALISKALKKPMIEIFPENENG